ncbi:MOSC domain-containing protein [Oryzihumus sp.]|uniref:MOSC domain-containing protein n=1 Tax=Oryzihumus sp. TaxID=1968903 RepID=UPI002ED9B4FC
MRLSQLHIHPLKSGAILPVEQVGVEPWGLAGDRRWMVVDAEGVLLSAREERDLFTVRASTPDSADTLVLEAPGAPRLAVGRPEAAHAPVRLHRHELLARPAGAEADEWLVRVLGRPGVRLVWCDDPTRRSPNPAYGRPGDSVALADGYPVTLATTASLRQLNDWIAEAALERGEPAPDPLPVQRFRPNLVIDGVDRAFAEDDWKRVRIGEVELRVVKDIDRCVMTTIDPDEPQRRDKEPIRTLSRHRRRDGLTWFGRQLIPDTLGTLRVGDELTVLD